MNKSTIAIKRAADSGYYEQDGHIFHNGRKLKTRIGTSGYPLFGIRVEGTKRQVFAHRLVAFLKFGSKMFDPGIQVRHLNGIATDFSRENISIGTASENNMDKPKEKRRAAAIKASNSVKKHNHVDIIKARMLGKKYTEIMKEFGITSKGTVQFIIRKSIQSQQS